MCAVWGAVLGVGSMGLWWGRVPVLTQLTVSSVQFKNILLKERKENAALVAL